jgi:hypothetical protein
MGLGPPRWRRHDHLDPGNLDPNLLMWDVRRNVASRITRREHRYVTEFRFSGVPANQRCYWLVFEGDAVDLCYKDPGFEVNLFVSGSLRLLTEIWLGHVTIDQAVREDRLRLDGSRRDAVAFRAWFALSMFAPAGGKPSGQDELAAT